MPIIKNTPEVRSFIEKNPNVIKSNYNGDRKDPLDLYRVDAPLDPDAALYADEFIELSPSEFTEYAIMIPDPHTKQLYNFSFEERRYLKDIYDSTSPRILLKCGRQVEKCLEEDQEVLLSDGRTVPIKELCVGDMVATQIGENISGVGMVTWKSRRVSKPCYKITTRQGHTLVSADTHPIRIWGGYRDTRDLRVGERVHVVRKAGEFGDHATDLSRIILTAYLIGDGSVVKDLSFTNKNPKILDEFEKEAGLVDNTVYRSVDESRGVTNLRIHVGRIREWMQEDGLYGKGAEDKFIPDWVYKLSEASTSIFLNRLWATDGHVKKNSKSKYSIEYSSISRELIRGVQRLLWKFGVPSKIRRNWPSYWKKQGICKYAYILRVETQAGVATFLDKIGAFTKSEDIPVPTSSEKNNRDTLPIEINGLIKKIVSTKEGKPSRSLRQAGLRKTLRYAPSFEKVRKYVDYFRSEEVYNQELVGQLEKHLDTDFFWDEIKDIEFWGEKWCYDITVDTTHNFVSNGIVTHNSTTLGNRILATTCIQPNFVCLYVSPASQQTKQFSNDRIKEPLETSPKLSVWTTNALSSNVFQKKFVNRSQIVLRYAFLNADRVRGIAADQIAIDEIQDIYTDNIPVIEECTSHSAYRYMLYSGTPKSLDNTIEKLWAEQSTQNEWVVPCDACGGGDYRHWNILDEDNIGPNFLMCDKCHAPLNPAHPEAIWASLMPNPRAPNPLEGFRVPQLMVPWIEWSNIIQKQLEYSRAKFYNEVLGLSYDSGTRPLTQKDMMDACNPEISMTGEALIKHMPSTRNTAVYMGVDWGTGENSFTVITLGTYMNGKFTIFYAHRCEGREAEPQVQLQLILRLVRDWRVVLIGTDYGGGFDRNDALQRALGVRRVVKYQYTTAHRKVKWDDGLKRFIVNRTEVMSDIFNAIKRRNVFQFPRWEEFEKPFAQDMLNIFSEYSEERRVNEYKKTPGVTDDTFHSVLVCFLVSCLKHPRPDVLIPAASSPV